MQFVLITMLCKLAWNGKFRSYTSFYGHSKVISVSWCSPKPMLDLGDLAFPVRGTACRHLSGMHRRWRRSVADDVSSRAEDCTFLVVVWYWLGDRDCTAQYNCCLPATTDCRRFCPFLSFVLFNFVRCPCSVWHNSVNLISTLLLALSTAAMVFYISHFVMPQNMVTK